MSSSFLKIEDFLEQSRTLQEKNGGIARLSRFYGLLSTPKKLKEKTNATGFPPWDIFRVNCPSITLGIETKEVDMVPRFYAKNYEYNDLSISFLESGNLYYRELFFWWIDLVLQHQSYQRYYFNDVKADTFSLYSIEQNGKISKCDFFTELLPFDINSIDYDVQDDGASVVLTTVRFKYRSHGVRKLTTPIDVSDFTK